MPTKEIKELRQQGKLDEAYKMAKSELEAESDNIWSKRNMSWVLYSQLNTVAHELPVFVEKIEELKHLELPPSEDLFWENISLVISKAARAINSEAIIDQPKLLRLFNEIKDLPLKKDSKWYSVLYSGFHKGMKESDRYLEFADWWDFNNFQPEDYEKEKLPNGKDIMAIAEQAYIAYAKHLLPKKNHSGQAIFDKEKALAFLPILSDIVESHPQFQYPSYFNAKLLLALGDTDHMLSALLPFAKKKRNDFWVWEVLAEAFEYDSEKVFACYCKALSCKSPEEMLVNLRQKMTELLIANKHYNEARTEIDLAIKARLAHGYKIPNAVISWQASEWYKNATPAQSNSGFYRKYIPEAETILFNDVPEELVIVEFVNSNKKMLNFISSEDKFGCFKYGSLLSNLKAGDVLKVRFKNSSKDSVFQIFTATRINDDRFKSQFVKTVSGSVRINEKGFGFVDDVYIHATLASKLKLKNGVYFTGEAIKSYNRGKKEWGWKLI